MSAVSSNSAENAGSSEGKALNDKKAYYKLNPLTLQQFL